MHPDSIVSKLFLQYHRFLIFFFPVSMVLGPAITNLIISISCLILIINIKYFIFLLKLINNSVLIFLATLNLYFIFTSIISENIFFSIEKSILYFRFILFSFSLFYYLTLESDKIIHFFYKYIIVIGIFLLIDSSVQYLTGTNLFGYEKINSKRVSSFFGEESILGNFVIKFVPIFILATLLTIKKQDKIVINISMFLLVFITFISGERSAFFLAIFFSFLVFLKLFFISKKQTILVFFIFFICFTIMVFLNPLPFERIFIDTYNEMTLNQNLTIISEQYNSHFLIAWEMFLQKPLFGHGVNMFREVCNEPLYINYNGCSTSPHSFYLQLLSETGIFGTIMIFMLLIYFFLQFFNRKTELHNCLFYATLIIFLWPISTSGNFFSTWINSPIHFILSFLIYLNYKQKKRLLI